MVVLVSADSMGSSWVQKEIALGLERSLHGALKVIPVILPNAQVPDSLSRLTCVHMTKVDSEAKSQLTAILNSGIG